jgi:hypothetical protein
METRSVPEQPRALDFGARCRVDLHGRVHTSAQTFFTPIAVPTGEVLQ